MVMADLFFKSGFDFIILHCNFQLRDEESTRDELFVQSLEKKYGKKVLTKKFFTKHFAEENKISIQESARALRYEWFEEIQDSASASRSFLATAHHADDNIETMLLFLFRGTGIDGLSGIPKYDKKRKIIRPLLFATREGIHQYALENKLKWVEDSSNSSDKYTRNFLRHKIIPEIESHFKNARQNLVDNIKRFAEAGLLYGQAIELNKKKILEFKGNEIHIPVLKLQKAEPLDTIIWEIIKTYNFSGRQINEVKKLFEAGNSSFLQSPTHKIFKNRNWLVIVPIENELAENILVERGNNQLTFANGKLKFEMLSAKGFQLSTDKKIAQVDAAKIQFPLLLRKWKQGDYFYPLGMKKKKKLSRFFMDEKLSLTQKEAVWVLEMDKKIIWVVGHRIDDRFKITASTKDIIQINFIEPGI